MTPNPPTSPTLSEYHGQTSRLCAALNITPPPCADRVRAEFEAVARWLQERQEQKRKMKELFQ